MRTMRPAVARIACLLALVVLLAGAGLASAKTYTRGFVPPEDWEQILEERRVLLPTDKDVLPSFWDWRNHEGVTPPKDQGDCGSCWAFAAAGEMEAKIRIYYGLTVDLSEQQIVSCNPYGSGCDGGWAGSAYFVFMHYGGVLEGCMPYEGLDAIPCSQDQYLKFTDMDNWVSITNNIDQIKTAVYNNGPVCTSVDANDAWDGYSGGVITAPGSGTNHLVLIVGWDDRVGDNGAWIVKNSWGANWGEAGYCYVAYGACNIGVGVTSINYTPPPVDVTVANPDGDSSLFGDATVTVNWNTANETVSAVDLYYGTAGSCQNEPIALGVPNTGSYDWVIPNLTTSRATILVFPSEGTYRGFGFTDGEFDIIGHQTRYVSPEGSNTPPYDTPAKAAHSIADAALVGAGRDTILVAGGDYLESGITLNSQAHVSGSWSADFTVQDMDAHPTRLRGTTGTMRFNVGAGDYCGVSHVVFYDCRGAYGAVPVTGRHGAAIISMGASPVIEHCVFENNRAETGTGIGWGGAIMAHGGTPVIRDCTFNGNVASSGGALALSQCVDAQVLRCEFTANATSDSSAAFLGGAVRVAGGTVFIDGGEVRGSVAGLGGALAVTDGATLSMVDAALAGNRTVGSGGGIHTDGSHLDLCRVDIAGNRSWTGAGAGINATGGTLSVANTSLVGNTAASFGGGVAAQSIADGLITNVLLHGNAAGTGGGMFLIAAGPVNLVHSVAAANSGGGFFLGGTGIVSGYNLAYGNTGGDFVAGQQPTDMVADPRFADEAGGDFAPGMHSPLVDTGDEAAAGDVDGGVRDRGLYGGPDAAEAGPGRITALQGSESGGTVMLTWPENPAAATYVVYRDSSAVFMPGAELVCQTLTAGVTECTDTPPAGDWYYLVCAVDATGRMGGYSPAYLFGSGGQVPVGDDGLPAALAITGVAPNPFNPRTTVSFAMPQAAQARVQVFDLRGHLVRTLHDGRLEAGRHDVVWDGTDRAGRTVATGVYFVRLDDGRQAVTRKAVLAK